jgi:hypothetical protein
MSSLIMVPSVRLGVIENENVTIAFAEVRTRKALSEPVIVEKVSAVGKTAMAGRATLVPPLRYVSR